MLKSLPAKIFLVASLLFSLVFLSFNSTFAADTGRGFTITPPIFELTANPGDKLFEVVSVFNSGSEDLSIVSTIENLKPMGEQGQVQVIGDSDEGLPTLKDWIKIKDGSFALAKSATKNVSFDINIPSNAEPGGHFATILFGTTTNKTDSTGATLSQKIGTLVLLTIAGQTKESAQVISFSSAKKLFWQNQKIDFKTRIRNDGNVYIRPRGFLTITDIFGRKISETEIDTKNILPSATREISIDYSTKHFFGPYTASLVLVYGNTNQNLNATSGFWIIPWIWTSIVLLVLILVIILRRRLWRASLILFGRDKN